MNYNGVYVPLAKNNDAKAFTVRQQILQNPDNTIGHPKANMYDRYLLFKELTPEGLSLFIRLERIFTSVGLETIWKEIVANAADNVSKSRRNGNLNVGSIDFNYEIYQDGSVLFSITNYGDPFPIDIVRNDVKKIDQLRPVMLFQEENSSTNYSNNRLGSGKNGIGQKATNIFSLYFKVELLNPIDHLSFVGEWKDNKNPIYTDDNKHFKVEEYNGTNSMTRISFIPDLKRFNLPSISSEIIQSLEAYMMNFSYANKIPVRINGDSYDFSDISRFANLYFTNSNLPDVIFTEYSSKIKKKIYNPWDPTIEFLARYTPNSSVQISFVNGLYTDRGGSHVDAVYNAISAVLVEEINNKIVKNLKKDIIKKKRKENKDKSKITDDEIEKTKVPIAVIKSKTITNRDIMKHVSVVINIQIDNPEFTGQTKEIFNSEINIKLDSKSETIIEKKWPLKKILEKELNSKVGVDDLKLINNAKFIDKFEHPNLYKKSKDLSIYMVEGDSAAGYARKLIDCYNQGKDTNGICKLKGVPLNVLTATIKQLSENNEFLSIIKGIGLKMDIPEDQMDTYYLDPKNFNTLHYKELIILTDSDTDGFHIRGLVLLMFFTYWRSLIARGFVKVWLTPYLRVTIGNTTLPFYTSNEWDVWLANYTSAFNQGQVIIPIDKFKFRWFKGLGSSEQEDIDEDFELNRSIVYTYDDSTAGKMLETFDKRYADARKEWLAQDININNIEIYTKTVTTRNINDFIDQELILFGRDANSRTLRRVYDGLSLSQRKLLFYSFKHFNISSTTNKKYIPSGTDTVAQEAKSITNYHHGVDSITGVLEGQARFYIGASNIQLYKDVGSFGTRFENGADCAAARYTKVSPSRLLPKIFRSEDLPVLDYKIEEGNSIEPRTYIPVVPVVLIIGVKATGNGWSSKIPCFNPFELIDYIKLIVIGEEDKVPKNMTPWYFGYQGEIRIVDRKTRDQVSEKTEDDDDTKFSIIYFGIFSVDDKKQIHVTELPIGISGLKYRTKLQEWKDKDLISGFYDKCTADMIYFVIIGWKGAYDHKSLGLSLSTGYGNFTCLDNNDNPIAISDTKTILLEFVKVRMEFYQLRQTYDYNKIQEQIRKQEEKKLTIELVNQDKLPLSKTNKKQQIKILEQYNLSYDILDTIKSSSFSDEGYHDIIGKISILKEELDVVSKRDNVAVYMKELDEFKDELNKFYEQKIEFYNKKFKKALSKK